MIEEKKNEFQDRAVLVAVYSDISKALATEYLEELEFLATTAKIKTIKTFLQRLNKPDTRYYVGKGKLQEIKEFIKDNDIGSVVFDDDLTPSQLRNLEKSLDCKIYDRSLLILDIFLFRAKTAQAKTQVELARYQYLLPRLTRLWTHLERQRGGTGTRGGAGEKEIETDRRLIRNQIKVLGHKLEKIEKQSAVQRKGRSGMVRVALVGYTNAGKSTLMNLITKSDVMAEDKLFATVDATVRKVFMEGITFLMSDTVGFIRKLPHHLIESFKSTLDEIREADVLVHLVDAHHPYHDHHIEVVENTLAEMGAANKPTILVYNKIDMLDEEEKQHLREEKRSDVVYISAKNKENIVKLRTRILKRVKKEHNRIYPNYLQSETY